MKKIFSKKVLIVLSVVFVLLFLLYIGISVADSYGAFDQTFEQFCAKLDINLDRNTIAIDAINAHKHGSVEIIDSKSEFDEYTGISKYDVFKEQDKEVYDKIVGKALQKYDDKYFENNALVIVNVETSSGSNRVVPTRVEIRNNTMTVKYEVYSPQMGTCDMGYWYIIVECGKEEAANLDKIEVYKGFIKVDELTK